MFGIMKHLKVTLCKDAYEAIGKGFSYTSGHKPVEITDVVVVQDGTQAHNATVDFVMQDEQGNKYVVMMTGNLLKSIPC